MSGSCAKNGDEERFRAKQIVKEKLYSRGGRQRQGKRREREMHEQTALDPLHPSSQRETSFLVSSTSCLVSSKLLLF